jgi:hypothetical protein
MTVPGALQALQALGKSPEHDGALAPTIGLIQLRASQAARRVPRVVGDRAPLGRPMSPARPAITYAGDRRHGRAHAHSRINCKPPRRGHS